MTCPSEDQHNPPPPNPRSTLYQIPSLIHHISPSHFPRSVQIQSTTPESIQIQCYRPESVISSTTILIIDASEIPFPESPHSARPCRARARAPLPRSRRSAAASTRISTIFDPDDQDHDISWRRRRGSALFPGGPRAGACYRPKSDLGGGGSAGPAAGAALRCAERRLLCEGGAEGG